VLGLVGLDGRPFDEKKHRIESSVFVSNLYLARERAEGQIFTAMRNAIATKLVQARVQERSHEMQFSTEFRMDIYAFHPDELAGLVQVNAELMSRRYAVKGG
jgi:hypothetical protein